MSSNGLEPDRDATVSYTGALQWLTGSAVQAAQTAFMQQKSPSAQPPALHPGPPGEPKFSRDNSKSGEGAASALEALKKEELSRHQLQPDEVRPTGD